MLEITSSFDLAEALVQTGTADYRSVRKRWLVLCLVYQAPTLMPSRAEGETKRVTARWIAKKSGYSASRVGQIVRDYNLEGTEMFTRSRKRPGAGRHGTLSESQQGILAKFLHERGIDTPLTVICEFIEKELEKPIHPATASRYRGKVKRGEIKVPPEPESSPEAIEEEASTSQKASGAKPQPSEKPKPQVSDAPATPDKQTMPEKTVTAEESDKRSQPESETTMQMPESATSSPPEPKPTAESPTRADTKKRAKQTISEKERIKRQQPALFETSTDEQT